MAVLQPLAEAALQGALDAWLAADPDAAARWRPLAGHVVAIEVLGLGLRLALRPEEGRVRVLAAASPEAAEPEVTVAAAPLALARLAAEGRAPAGQVRIRGDAGLARALEAALKGAAIDWEGLAARWIGDTPAHQLGRAARAAAGWARESGARLARDLAEHLTEEARDLPPRAEVEDFLDAVDRLRDDLERLEARVRRLEAARAGGGGG